MNIKPSKQLTTNLCARSIDFASFYDFYIGFWKCPDNVVFFFFFTSLLNNISRWIFIECLKQTFFQLLQIRRNIVPTRNNDGFNLPMFDTTRLKTDVHFYYQYISLIQDVENTKYLLYNTTYVKMAEIIKNYLREALCLSSIKEWCVRNSKLPKPTLNMSFQNKSESEYQFIVLQTLTKLQSYIVDWRSQ